ncbi:PREDICTED: glutamyl aminopeptidase-like [Rhagoletis zephyria]|uniref:glutamyl aminopeptidase-like n=1 Tax=Rhagoletis zephyria TaxID=28612 RepID=UPI00081164C8|nr:PREDICTED: glutamyl aminopeptidase-like [Rhagoletis zephyria]
MYPQSKVPPVRPRSSLSTDDHHYRIRDCDSRHCRKKPNNAFITLVGFCLVLIVLCAFLLGALIYVGRTIVNGPTAATATTTTTTAGEHLTNEQLFSPANLSILRIRTTTDFSTSVATHSSSKPKMKSAKLAIDPAVAAASKVLKKLSFRLPREIRPQHYSLRLQPDMVKKLYQGTITIKLEVVKPISYIPVHAKTLNVSTEEVMQLGEAGAPVAKLSPTLTFAHPEYEYWVTEFKDPLQVGSYTLQLAFNGSLTDRIVGFYASSYLDSKTKERRWIATTKFEPTYARTAFPCFDEPALKAAFIITVVRPTEGGYHALSNMPIESEVVNGNVTEVTFSQSVPMSTYLACIIVSDFASQSKTVNGTLEGADDFEMRVFATSNQIDKVTYALDIGVGITEYYIGYFSVSYPLPKLDMAAIPDFVSGAMEHWGLVTYRETALLYDPTISSSANKQRVATVVAHELAHMWFGNLVTMKWWNDLWLNEGFASYIEYKGINKVHPEWDMLDQFLASDLHSVLNLDATLASHPIVQTVESPAQITELFDSITYSKGASVIRMLEDLVGEEKFRNATKNYLLKFYYSNAETDDFLTEIEALESDFDVKLIMQTWTEQMGLPVVEVAKDGNTYTLTQKRFLSNPEDYDAEFEESKFNYHWSIPITYYTSDNADVERTIFNYNDNEVKITLNSTADWIKFNKNQVGYYRVNYAPEQWQQLTNALISARGQFSNADRAHLINDAFSLADASQLDYSIALNLVLYLEKELDYVPWSVASSRLLDISNLLYYTDSYRDFVVFARKLIVNAYENVTWTVSTDHLDNLLRVSLLNLAGRFGYEPMLKEAATRFTAWLSNSTDRPDPDIRWAVYYFGMQSVGDEKSWDQIWELFINEQDAQEKVKLMEALSAVNSPWILQRYINLAWNESYVRSQDYFTCLSYISRNRIGQSLVWDYVRENWPNLVERFGINERYLGRLIPTITARFVTQTKLEEMEAFFAKYPEAGAGTAARKQALETVKFNIKWLQQNKQKIAQWLSEQTTVDESITTTTVEPTTQPASTQ